LNRFSPLRAASLNVNVVEPPLFPQSVERPVSSFIDAARGKIKRKAAKSTNC